MKNIIVNRRKLSYQLFPILFLILFSCSRQGKQEGTNKGYNKKAMNDLASQIDSLIATTQPRIFNGVILITKDGKSIYEREKGYSNFNEKAPISIHNKFRIMSNSKQITAVLIMKEVEKGNIDLQQPIGTYLMNLPQTWADSVTIHQLLNMSSGISDPGKPLLFEPGKGYFYSNPGYGLLGKVIEQVTEKQYSSNANDLFDELGMNNTYCYQLNGGNEGLIDGHTLLKGKTEPIDFNHFGFDQERWNNFLPAGGVVSDVHDLNKWDNMLHKGEILAAESYEQMVYPTNRGPHAAFDNDSIGYGYGLRIGDKHPVTHIGHGGRGFGFVSLKFYIPEKDIDVIIWENIYSRDNDWMGGDEVYYFENEIRKIVLKSVLLK